MIGKNCTGGLLGGFDQRFFEGLAPAIRALRRHLQNVVRHASSIAGHTIQNQIERDLRVAVAVLAGLDKLCSSACRLLGDEDDLLFFR